MKQIDSAKCLRIGLLITLFINYIFIFFSPSDWTSFYLFSGGLYFNGFKFIPSPLLGVLVVVLVLILVNIFIVPLFVWDLIVGFLLIFLRQESVFAHCHWADLIPIIFFMLGFFELGKSYNLFRFDLIGALRITVALVYFSSVSQRLVDSAWLSGDFFQNFLFSATFSKLAFLQMTSMDIPKWPTYLILILEGVGVLIVFRRVTRMAILFVAPIHLFLLVFSTEVTWQLFFLSMLFVIYKSNEAIDNISEPKQTKKKLLWILPYTVFFIAALPYDFRLKPILPTVALARNILLFLKLDGLYSQRLFHTSPYLSYCPVILSQTSSDSPIVSEFKQNPTECLIYGQGILQNHLTHSLLQVSLQEPILILKTAAYPEEKRIKLITENVEAQSTKLAWALCFGRQGVNSENKKYFVGAIGVSGTVESPRFWYRPIVYTECDPAAPKVSQGIPTKILANFRQVADDYFDFYKISVHQALPNSR